MIFKRFLSAFCALAICAGMADAKPVDCKSASGILDPLGYKLELNIVCNADGYYADTSPSMRRRISPSAAHMMLTTRKSHCSCSRTDALSGISM